VGVSVWGGSPCTAVPPTCHKRVCDALGFYLRRQKSGGRKLCSAVRGGSSVLRSPPPLPAPWCTKHVATGERPAPFSRWQQRPGLCFDNPFVEELRTPPPLPAPWCTKHVATRERSAHFCRWQQRPGLYFALTFQAHPLGGQTSFLLALGRVRLGGCTPCHRGHSCQQPWCGRLKVESCAVGARSTRFAPAPSPAMLGLVMRTLPPPSSCCHPAPQRRCAKTLDVGRTDGHCPHPVVHH
jgi:hypothetical protein